MVYDFAKIEKKWQKKWEANKTFMAVEKLWINNSYAIFVFTSKYLVVLRLFLPQLHE